MKFIKFCFKDCEGCSALHHAARERRADCVRLLVERGASLEVRDSSAWTAFLWACYVGSTEIAEILLSAGADVNTKGLHNCTGQFGRWVGI